MCLLYAPRVRLPVRHNQELFDIWGGALARVRMCLSSRGGRGIPSMGSGARVLANAKFGQQCEERLDPDATDRGAGGVILKIADRKTKMKHCACRSRGPPASSAVFFSRSCRAGFHVPGPVPYFSTMPGPAARKPAAAPPNTVSPTRGTPRCIFMPFLGGSPFYSVW